MTSTETEGKTIEEALHKALKQLELSEDEVTYEILKAPSRGFLGIIGAHPARLRVTAKGKAAEKTEKAETRSAQPPKAAPAPQQKRETKPTVFPSDKKETVRARFETQAAPEPSGPISDAIGTGGFCVAPPASVQPVYESHEKKEGRPADAGARRAGERRPRRFERHRGAQQSGHRYRGEEKPARLKHTVRPASTVSEAVRQNPPLDENGRTPMQRAEKFLQDIFACMGLSVTWKTEETEEGTLCHLQGENLGILIGKHGQTLDSLQYLTNLAANRGREDGRVHVVLDVEDYRARREETLRRLALHLAEKACRIHAEVCLEPMNRHERKIIHMALSGNGRVRTYSAGDEPHRCVVIAPKHHRGGAPRRSRREQAPKEAEEAPQAASSDQES